MTETIQLTKYSHGAGCGCKIAPQVLDTILKSNLAAPDDKNLLVGNSSKDDAAAYDIGNGMALISTTDFFMPIVDDPFSFGRIAGANAISDVYAMGGRPILAIAILGWPVDKLAPGVAQQVVEGARSICAEAGIALAGGHSIDNPEPIFGLAVNGLVRIEHLKRNSTAQPGDLLFLTKPIGIGLLSTAQKKGLLQEDDLQTMMKQLMQLNSVGEKLGSLPGVHAMTDVTGFGLMGHLVEMCEGSRLSATVHYLQIPIIPAAEKYLAMGAIPGGTQRNWASYGQKLQLAKDLPPTAMNILADPQTNGGLLIAVDKKSEKELRDILTASQLTCAMIGELTEQRELPAYVR